MDIVHEDLVPDPGLDREEMLACQDRIRERASFQTPRSLIERLSADDLIVAGVDQSFPDDDVVSAIVALAAGEVIDRAVVRQPVQFPYIPGLLSFREAGAALTACTALDVEPDLLLVDGNGRLHFREAGLATHLGVVLEQPTVGVAKRLLCGTLVDPPEPPYPTGTRVEIRGGEDTPTARNKLLGVAMQTRQWDHPDRHINPVYVSPGHRISPDHAADVVECCVVDRKLPEPIRAADQLASEAARD